MMMTLEKKRRSRKKSHPKRGITDENLAFIFSEIHRFMFSVETLVK
jgi:hypothetical protein